MHDIAKPDRIRNKQGGLAKAEGKFESETEAKLTYKSFDHFQKIQKVKVQDHLQPLTAPMDDKTESRESYNDVILHGDASNVRRLNKAARVKTSISNGRESKPEDNKSESRQQYSVKYGRRSDRMKPKDSLLGVVERSKSMSSLQSISSTDYRGGFTSKRPEKVRNIWWYKLF